MTSLFDVLQSYNDFDTEQRRKPTLQTVISTDLPLPAAPSFSLRSETEGSHHNASDRRHVLNGTSRVAFGNKSDLSDMFQQKSSTKKASSEMEVDDLHVESITLAPQTDKESKKANPISTSGKSSKQAAPPSTDAKLNSHFPNKKPSTTATPSSNANHANTASAKPKPSTFTVGSKPIPGKPTPQAAVGATNVQHGKVAAMAKMASLGEEWPEEEELPGMSHPSTSSLNKDGDLTKSGMRQVHNAVQRQQKVITAKRKV